MAARHMAFIFRCACLAVSWTSLGIAKAATGEAQAWFTMQTQFRPDENDLVTLDVSQRFRERRSGDEQQLARISYDHVVAPGVQIGGGVAYLHASNEREHRLFQQVSVQSGRWLARTRLEQRFYDNGDRPLLRLRQRLQYALPIDRPKRWTLMAAGEAMWHLTRARPGDTQGFATWRAQLGVRRTVTRNFDVQLVYMRQHSIRERRPDAIAHIPWLTLGWRI